MYVKREEEFQYAPVIENCIEDYTGGLTIARADITGLDELPPGYIAGTDERGLGHVIKTAKVKTAVAEDGKAITVNKGHLFKVGDAVTTTNLTGVSSVIGSITNGSDSDILNVTSAFGVIDADAVLVEAKGEAVAGSAELKYKIVGVTKNKIDLTVANQQSGVMARGSVNEKTMPQPIDTAIKALLPLIRFV